MSKINLRPFEVEDVPKLKDWFYSGDYPEFFRDMLMLTDEQLKIYSYMKDGQGFVIRKDEGSIGFVLLYEQRIVPQTIKVGILIDVRYQRNGYCLEAMRRVLDYTFDKLNIRKVIVEVCGSNKRLQEIVTTGGFQYEAILLKEAKLGNEYSDVIRYYMDRDMYQQIRS